MYAALKKCMNAFFQKRKKLSYFNDFMKFPAKFWVTIPNNSLNMQNTQLWASYLVINQLVAHN